VPQSISNLAQPKPQNKKTLSKVLLWLSVVPILGAGAYLLYFAPSPLSVSIVSATVESFAFEVSASELMKLPLNGFTIVDESDPAPLPPTPLATKGKVKKLVQVVKPICYSGLFVPANGSNITYTRFGDDPVAIAIERSDGQPVGLFEAGTQKLSDSVKKSSHLKFIAVNKDDKDKETASCDGKPTPRLPVYGFGDLGSEVGPTGQSSGKNLGTLIEGTIDVLAHSVQVRSAVAQTSQIYSTNNQTVLPPGSRLVQFTPDGGQKQPWIGFAVLGDSSIELHINSDAKRLAIIRPGHESQPEILSVGLLTQLGNDPILAAMQIIGAVLFSVFQLLGRFFGGGSSRNGFDI
jgi:hypothetical protein